MPLLLCLSFLLKSYYRAYTVSSHTLLLLLLHLCININILGKIISSNKFIKKEETPLATYTRGLFRYCIVPLILWFVYVNVCPLLTLSFSPFFLFTPLLFLELSYVDFRIGCCCFRGREWKGRGGKREGERRRGKRVKYFSWWDKKFAGFEMIGGNRYKRCGKVWEEGRAGKGRRRGIF